MMLDIARLYPQRGNSDTFLPVANRRFSDDHIF
jgi:hypothetical protein